MSGAPVALISGITGQDGSLLSELLLDKGYIVHGIKRRSSSFNTSRIEHLYQDQHSAGVRRFVLHYGDMTDATSLLRLVQRTRPDELYHLAAQSHVQVSFELPEYTGNADALGTLRMLEALHLSGLQRTRFIQASTSELYGNASAPQHEETPFQPASPYAVAKLYAYWITVNYREAYGMHASNGIMFNHESPVRGETFLSRKVTRAVARIQLGIQGKLYLGNLEARRDWGHARDYVEGLWRAAQQDAPGDYVFATGECHSVREFVERAFGEVGVSLVWRGSGEDEIGVDAASGETRVCIDPRHFRPQEVHELQGDATKARRELGWRPTVGFEDLVREMVAADLAVARRGLEGE